MSRRGGSLYISTDPNNNTPIGAAGEGISIGPLGTLLYNPSNEVVPPDGGTVNIPYGGALHDFTFDPPGPLSALTLTFDNGLGVGDQLFITFTQAITTITFSGANIATSPALPTSITAGQQIAFTWDSVGVQWVRTL